ncbi:MAG: hypothetical protein GQ576_00140 [Methanococcoides sp.]|nr:hypothetical protein [Methanococcoides sp.]
MIPNSEMMADRKKLDKWRRYNIGCLKIISVMSMIYGILASMVIAALILNPNKADVVIRLMGIISPLCIGIIGAYVFIHLKLRRLNTKLSNERKDLTKRIENEM